MRIEEKYAQKLIVKELKVIQSTLSKMDGLIYDKKELFDVWEDVRNCSNSLDELIDAIDED